MNALRSALFNAFFFVTTFLLALTGAPVLLLGRDRMLGYARAWARLELWALRFICGVRYEVVGGDNLPADGPCLIASRHQSAFDTLVWLCIAPRCAYVFKNELLRIPVIGRMMKAAGMIPVDREAGAASLRTLVQRATEAARDDRQIVIFPEGTRSAFGHPGALQPGIAAVASMTRLPVIPVATNSGLFWGPRAFRKNPGTVRIFVGRAILPDTPRAALMRQLRAALADIPGPVEGVDNSVGTPMKSL